MNTATRLLAAFILAPLAFSAPAFASAVEQLAVPVAESAAQNVAIGNAAAAQATIEKLGATAMNALKDASMTDDKKKALFVSVLGQNFDMDRIARFAAGKYWRQATPEQQAEYQRLYRDMVINVYTSRFKNYAGQEFTVTGSRQDDSGDAVVTSRVTGKGAPINVDWRVRDGKVIDVMVEGVSMAVTQRNDFAGVIQQGGGTFTALTDYLRKGGTSDVKN